jgi:hypothetical protein
MTKISSGMMTFHKKIFPAIWFGFLGVFFLVGVLTGAAGESAHFLIVPLVMGLSGFILMKKLLWNLVDEVWDCGDYLLIRNGDEEESIQLSNIMNISVSTATNPPRITLRLTHPSRFGNEIAFSPLMKFTLNPFAKNPIAEDLTARVDRAQSGRPA